jgi:hypothetical protein
VIYFLLCFQRKYLKHQAFENEVNGRAEQVDGVINLGNSLIERRVCDGDEENMQVKSVLRQVWPQEACKEKSPDLSVVHG